MPYRSCAIERLERQPFLSIRGETSFAGAPSFFDRCFSALYAHVSAKGGVIAGAPLSCTHAVSRDGMDVEVALPLREPIPGTGTITAGEVPPVEAVVSVHVGPYSALTETYAALMEYLRGQGREPLGMAYEFYLDDPGEVPPRRRRTRVALPLRPLESR